MVASTLALAIAGGVELAKLALQIYFLAMNQAGKTQQEMDEFYAMQSDYFITHRPETLPDVGEEV